MYYMTYLMAHFEEDLKICNSFHWQEILFIFHPFLWHAGGCVCFAVLCFSSGAQCKEYLPGIYMTQADRYTSTSLSILNLYVDVGLVSLSY